MKVYAEKLTSVIGMYADLDGIAIVVTQVKYGYEYTHVIDNFTVYDIRDVDLCKVIFKNFKEKYNVKYFLGNKQAHSITKEKTSFANDGSVFNGWENLEVDVENLVFLVQSNIKVLKFEERVKSQWKEELNSFDVNLVRNKTKSYPLTFALGLALQISRVTTWFTKESLGSGEIDGNFHSLY